ncbi:MAG: hypothetical protein NVS2B6_08650 [Thermoleophilaceae bacterium]
MLAALAITLALAACGSSTHARTAPATSGGDVAVVRGWAEALAAGRVDEAARYFALPATVQNGTPALRLGTHRLVRAFNASLPCGARILSARPFGRYTIVTFRLIDRPGGSCGSGVGGLAATAFVIRGSKIVEWRRAPVPGAPQMPPPAPAPAPGGGALST